MMRTPRLSAASALALLVLGGCRGSACEGKCVGVTFTVHVEGWEDQDDDQRAAHLAVIDKVLDAVEAHNGRASIELGAAFLTAILDHEEGTPLAWQARSHTLGLHASTLPAGQDEDAFIALLDQQRQDGLRYGIDGTYISGACGPLDWVSGLQEVGFAAVAGMTGWCLGSYDPASVPDEFVSYEDCRAPEDCHAPVPNAPEEVIHPWRSSSSAAWLTPADSGLLLVSGSGSLRCMAEYADAQSGSECDYDAADNEAALDHLDGCIAAGGTDSPEVCGVTWAVGEEPDPYLLDAFLAGVQQRVEADDLQWTTVPDVIQSAPE